MMAEKNNRSCFLLACAALALSAVILFLPIYHFDSTVYTKRSSNTFVGDEKYTAARAEVDAEAEKVRALGLEVEITEEIIERVNSKGETTSLIVFRVNQETRCTGWRFISTGFPSGMILIAMLALEAVALGLSFFGLKGAAGTLWRFLPRGKRALRRAAVACALLAMILVPVFAMVTNVIINRRIGLYAAGAAPAPAMSVLASADQLIYLGRAGENTAQMLKTTSTNCMAVWWLQLIVIFGMVTALAYIAEGQVKKPLSRGALYFGVIVTCLVILYPYVVMLTSAFRTDAEANDVSFLHLFPTVWRWENLPHILGRGIPRYLLNSLLLSSGATALALLCGIPAAYAMARMRFKGRKAFLGFVIMSQMFSPVVLLVGISRLMLNMRLNDTILGLVFVNAAFNQAFAIWLLRGTFVSISPEMEQAACIDGCNSVSALVRVLLPMAAPGIVTTLIFVFINAWNEYTISTVLINTDLNRPITVGLTQFAAFSMIQWNYLFMSSLLATIPVIILFMLIEKHLVSGLTSGGVKG